MKRNKLAGAALKNLDEFRKQNVEEKSELYVQYVQYDVIFIKVNNMQNKPVYCFLKKNKKKTLFFLKKKEIYEWLIIDKILNIISHYRNVKENHERPLQIHSNGCNQRNRLKPSDGKDVMKM